MWGGRFKRAAAEVTEGFSRSLGFDRRLAPYDIAASAAYARALGRAGVLSRREVTRLSDSLEPWPGCGS
jgi:argininosuccinate lyase